MKFKYWVKSRLPLPVGYQPGEVARITVGVEKLVHRGRAGGGLLNAADVRGAVGIGDQGVCVPDRAGVDPDQAGLTTVVTSSDVDHTGIGGVDGQREIVIALAANWPPPVIG